MPRRHAGFTMIELIVVIVILGILAAAALPRFFDMRGESEQAVVDGVAGAAAAAMNLNYGGCGLKNNVPTTDKCTTINLCSQVGGIMQGGLDANYTAAPNVTGSDIGTTNGATATCKVSKTVGATTYTATFTGIAAGN